MWVGRGSDKKANTVFRRVAMQRTPGDAEKVKTNGQTDKAGSMVAYTRLKPFKETSGDFRTVGFNPWSMTQFLLSTF